MFITDFTGEHIEQAALIAMRNYQAERACAGSLPPVAQLPDITPFAQSGLGVAAFDGEEMLGFLCVRNPWVNAWDIPGLRHVFSPMGANGTVSENRAAIYARLYQAAGEKWARAGAASHGISLYAHDTEGQAQFFRYGFGMRCIDAIRGMDEISAPPCEGYIFEELTQETALEALALENMLHSSYLKSPFFMSRATLSEAEWREYFAEARPVCLIAKHEGRGVAFIIAEAGGETFIKDTPGYLHCTGMYCLPEHRGTGVGPKLLSLMIQLIKARGYTRFGTDYESFNPSGSGFWGKHFTPYTHSVVRRIDEGAIKKEEL